MSIQLQSAAIAAALSKLDLSGVPLESRESVFTIAIARLLAYDLPVNVSPVDPNVAFASEHRAGVEVKAAAINEHLVVNIDHVVELARRIWVFRYRLAYDPFHSSVNGMIDALVRCGSSEIPASTSDDFTRYADHIEGASKIIRPLVLSFSGR